MILLGLLGGPALAEHHVQLVLADSDPELRRALAEALAPRAIDVVVDGTPVPDERAAAARATQWQARYVVWRDADQLVVYDQDGAVVNHRYTQVGILGPAAARATASTTVALLHLPVRDVAGGLQVRAEIGGVARIPVGTTNGDVAPRFVGDIAIRPSPALGLRLGLADEFGATTKVVRGTFAGNASDHEAHAFVAWTLPLFGPLEVEPYLMGGVARGSLTGFDDGVAKSATAWFPSLVMGAHLRAHFNALTVALGASLHGIVGTPLAPTGLEVVVPGLTFEVGLTAGVELGR